MIQKNRCLQEKLYGFAELLKEEEKSKVTIEKYLRDTAAFLDFLSDKELNKEIVLEYKEELVQKGYAVRSVNSMLASVNAYLRFIGREECRVRSLRIQRQIYTPADRVLSRTEYERLVSASRNRPRLCLLLQTICATGIRVSELRFFTVEAARKGEVIVNCKNKYRVILIPAKLQKKLLYYCKQKGFSQGIIFRTRSGKSLDRSQIWAEMKSLCVRARVAGVKVFPHNLRKLFARCFYKLERDIAKLADLLGHSSIETTRIYIASSGREHRRELERLRLIL